MTRFSIDVEVNGQPKQVVKRNIESPAIIDGVLFIDDLGIRCDDIDLAQECVVTLRMTRRE